MNEIQKKHGPFAVDVGWMHWPGTSFVVTSDVSDRLRLVRESSDPEWLAAVVAMLDVQKAVRQAAERRLRRMNDPSSATTGDSDAGRKGKHGTT